MDFSGDAFFRGRNTWLDSGYMLRVSTLVILDEFHTFFYVAADLDPAAFLLHAV